ncbi:hypothetical protein [Pseudomonas sp.]|uniref:hypothetical protein n=1 Tax=Pseudomonas sp. TaxID=306 RepID=UPI001B17F076|nr:hypothetical protein [Pseudomonas sp.]MBO9549066.1 hypothetical protein [Pseudomonas sp.]
MRVQTSVWAAVGGRGFLTSRTAATQSVRKSKVVASRYFHPVILMKKIVPDPPPSFPLPYLTIIADLTVEDAKPHAAALMDSLSSTIQVLLETESQEHRQVLLENMNILTELLRTLFSHMATREMAHEQ